MLRSSMRLKTNILGVLMCSLATFPALAASGAAQSGCRALLTTADAQQLAAATPNARAFRENYGATITTQVARTNPGESVTVRVVANDTKHGRTVVGLYTVSLSTGHVTDDDQEPAEDSKTDALRERIVARHCGSR